mmetsp:Transcript_15107/g.38064  ORF Transcript_15107/g.38064 Transcript_15107/m.38064 type:complete len:249 (+) Transcript_15107:180-926(+)
MPSTPSNTDTEKASEDNTSSSGSSWSSWFVSPSVLKERFQEFDDQQRIDRLSECRKLDKILHECRKRNQPGKPKSRYTKKSDKNDPIESVSIGVRNMKYFGWRGILKPPSNQSANDEASDADGGKAKPTAPDGPDLSVFHPQIRSSCAREEHAVWACRAIATGCGKDLSELKKCFEEIDEQDANYPPHVRVLTSSYTNYQGIVEKIGSEAIKEQIPCHEIQWRLGSCVTESGKQLLERKQQREKTQKQ